MLGKVMTSVLSLLLFFGVISELLRDPTPTLVAVAASPGTTMASSVGVPYDQALQEGYGSALAAADLPEVSTEVAIPWLPETVRQWSALLIDAGQRHRVDPEALAIIVIVESGGNPNAVSGSGAIGLMQLMPATAQGVAAELGWTGFRTEQLYDPATNIEFGAKYLAQQLAAFGRRDDPDWQQSVELAAAAYNGGPGALSRHLTQGAGLSSEATQYRYWVGGMWKERHELQSPTFQQWWDAGGRHLVQVAEVQMAAR